MTSSLLHKGQGKPIPEHRDKFALESQVLKGKGKFIAPDHRAGVRGGSITGSGRCSQQSDGSNFLLLKLFELSGF